MASDFAPASDCFGSSVSISGKTAIIGAPYDNYNGISSGSAYVFYCEVKGWFPDFWWVWGQEAKLLASDGEESDLFGLGKSMAVAGNKAIIGACQDDDNGLNSGSAYAFGVVRDTDEDGIRDSEDNCPRVPNFFQADSDSDDVGNVCDNCPNNYNPYQEDSGDGLVLNGDMEDINSTAWVYSTYGTLNGLEPSAYVSTPVHTGNYSYYLSGCTSGRTAGSYVQLKQTITAPMDINELALDTWNNYWRYASGTYMGYVLYEIWVDETKLYSLDTRGAGTDGMTGWLNHRFDISNYVSPNQPFDIVFRIYSPTGTGGWTAQNYIDDVKLTRGIGGPEIGDGIGDICDNCPDDYNPEQDDSDDDGIGDICECDAANINGIDPVNFDDFAIVGLNWLLSGPNLEGDTNWDEKVDFWDLAQVAQHWLCNCNEP